MPPSRLPSLEELLTNPKARERLTELQLYNFINQLKELASGLGRPDLAEPDPATFASRLSKGEWKMADHLKYLSSELASLERREKRFLAVSMPPRHGKQLAHDTPVPTPTGFVQHGELKVGDLVFGRDGKAYPVLALGPESGEDDVQLTFSDGSSVVCHENHEWTVFDRSGRRERTLETKAFFERKLEAGPISGRGHRYQIQLPSIEPVWGSDRDLPLDPYVLGAWLGDGKSTDGVLAHHDSDRHVVDRISRHFPVQNVYSNKSYPRLSLTLFSRLRRPLKALGVLRSKHIPEQYLFASETQRRELLAGLIDTDGSVGCDARVRFSNTNARLVEDVRTLVCSLGYRAGVVEVEPKLSSSGVQGRKKVFQVCFTPHDQEAASMPRKQHGVFGVRRRLAIVKVERVPPVKGRCIQTAAPDGVYLVTKSFIPTHNSLLIDVWFPIWWLTRNPRARIILAGYNETFARQWGAQVRDKILELSDETNIVINKDQTAATDWLTSLGGGMMSVGVGGALTGYGADLLIIDDPIKNDAEANSEVYRNRMWDWWQASALTRLQPNGVVVAVATRWHEDDLLGRIDKENDGRWTILKLAALAEKDDPLGREIGSPLWPERFPDDPDYSLRQGGMSPYWWSALFQQRPTPEGGGLIQRDWFRFYHSLPDDCDQWIQSWDPALLDRATSDYWAGQVWARRGADLYLVDSARGHYNLAQATGIIRTWSLKYPKATGKLIENTAMGPAVIQTLQHEVPGIIPWPPQKTHRGSKRSRVEAITPVLMAGNVHLPENPDGTKPRWVWDLVEECAAFDKGTHDDQVDALSAAISFLLPGAWRTQKQALDDANKPAPPTPREERTAHFNAYTQKVLNKAARRHNQRQGHRLW